MEYEPILYWHSPEHQFDKKSNDWYWILAVIVLGASVLSFYFGNILFGIFIIIAGATIGMLSYKETKIMQVKVTVKGIICDKSLYPWNSFRSFWIEDEHVQGSRMLLNPANSLRPLMIIPINEEEIDLNDVRDVLLEFLDEEFLEESLVQQWFDKLLNKW